MAFFVRKTFFPHLLFVVATLLIPAISGAGRYPDPVTPTNSFVFLYGNATVNGAPLAVGDEVAAYSIHPIPGGAGKTFEKVLIGHGVVTAPGRLDTTPAYGDDPGTPSVVEGAIPGEEISLVLWRASEGKEYTAYLDRAGNAGKVTWSANMEMDLVDIDFVEGQRIPLRNGAWNLFAYSILAGYDNVMPTQPQLAGVLWQEVVNVGDALPLRSVAGKYDRVLGNDGSGAKFWNPSLPSASSLKSLSPGYGYWIRMKPDSAGLPLSWMTFVGPRTSGGESLSLGSGWTLAGYWADRIYCQSSYDCMSDLYPVDATDNVTIAAMGELWASIDTRYARLISFDAWGAKAYLPAAPAFSNLKSMGPGYGYWVKMTSAGVLSLPSRTSPIGVQALAGDNEVTVSWLPVPGATAYNLYWGTSAGVTKGTGTPIPGISAPYVHTGRTNGTTYHYVVTAVVGGAEGAESAEVSATPAAQSFLPSITAFSPANGIAGDNVAVVGGNFTVGGTSVHFYNGLPATVLSNTGTVLQVRVPPGATTGPISVTTVSGTATSASSFTVIVPPPAPGGVSATAGVNQVTLAWSQSPGATAYRVYWANTPSVTKLSYSGMIDNATFPLVHSPLTAGIPYYYVVTAFNRAGESAESSPVASATPPLPPPTITGFSPTSGFPGSSVTITGTNFIPTLGGNTVTFNEVAAAVTNATSSQIVATVPGSATTGKIAVTTSSGAAVSTGVFSVPTLLAVTTEPATDVSLSGATLNGTVTADTTTVAWFEWGVDPGMGTFSVTPIEGVPLGDGITARAVSSSVSGFVSGATYYYRCVASNYSGTQRGEILAFTPVLAAPTGLTAIAVNSGNITLEWTASSDNSVIAGYRVYREGVPVGTTTATAYYDNGLAASTPYRYRVKAFDSGGTESSFSNEATATTYASGGSSLLVRVLDGLRLPHAGGDNVFIVLGASDGAAVASGIPDGNGEIFFADPPPNATVTMAKIRPGSYPEDPPSYLIDSVFDVNVPAITLFSGDDSRVLGTANLNISYSVNGVVKWKLFSAYNYPEATNVSPLVVTVRDRDIQSDGKVSFLVVGYDNTGNAIGYGTVLDATFTNGMTANVSINRTDFTSVNYLIQNVPAAARQMRASMNMSRKGVTSYNADNTLNPPLPTVIAMAKVPSVYWDSFEYDLEFSYDQDGNGVNDSHADFEKRSSVLENPSFDAAQALPPLPLPANVTVSNTGTARPTISWVWSGAASTVDRVDGNLGLGTSYKRSFHFAASPVRQSVTIPQMPRSLKIFESVDPTSYSNVEYLDYDIYTGWDQFWNVVEQYVAGTLDLPALIKGRYSEIQWP